MMRLEPSLFTHEDHEMQLKVPQKQVNGVKIEILFSHKLKICFSLINVHQLFPQFSVFVLNCFHDRHTAERLLGHCCG